MADDSSKGAGSVPAMVDMSQLASLLMQARGPLLDRVTRQIAKFDGDGSVEVTEWLAAVERVCKVEGVKPESVVSFLLDGEPARLFRRLSVAEAEDWDVVKKALMNGYASPMPAVYKEWHSLSLREGESVDGYVDKLERLAGRLRVGFGSTIFRSRFYDGLPRQLYEWAASRDGAYDDDCDGFNLVLARVRERVATQRAVGGRESRPSTSRVSAAAPRSAGRPARSGSRGGAECYRCGERGHRVKSCPVKPSRRPTPTVERGPRCWRCGKGDHVIRDCPEPPPLASAAASGGSPVRSDPPAVPSTSAAGIAAAVTRRPSVRLTGWMEVDEETGKVVRVGGPEGFYLEDAVRGTASSPRE